jgi:nucleotidyltransferase substrate binding protein (TIGR01987 family)
MSDSNVNRWRQRLENFRLALGELSEACAQQRYSKLERAGLVQTFEFTFELAWKSLKDLLYYQGFEVRTPREALRQAFAAALLDEEGAEALLDALDKRNLLAHTYRETLAKEAENLIKQRYHPALRRLLHILEERAGE